MAATEYSLGIDLGQTPSQTATVRGGEAGMFAPLVEVPVGALDAQTHTVHRIAATVAQLVEREGIAPSTIVLSVADDERVANSGLPGLVARHLGLDADRVRLIGATEATRLGLAQQGAGVGDAAASAGALGAALSGAPSSIGGPLAAGLGGALAGGLGAALVAEGAAAAPTAAGIGPTGTPLGPVSAVGPTGTPLGATPLAGPTGTPLGATPMAGPAGTSLGSTPMAGPTGTPLGSTTAVGPTGTPLAPPPAPVPPDVPIPSTGSVARRSRLPLIAGAVAVVVVAVGAIAVAAGGGDSPAAEPTVAETVAPTPTDAAVAITVAPSSSAAPDATLGATLPGGSVPAIQFVAACVVGSWLADNSTINSGIFSVLPASVAGLVEVGASTGTIILDIAADGTLTTTFDNFTVSANLTDGSATVASTATGKESGTATFADDGSFSGDITHSDTQMHVTFNGATMFDGTSPVPVIHGSGTYTCTHDQLQITNPGDPLVATYTRNG